MTTTEEAIRQLQKLKSDKQQQSADTQTNVFSRALTNLKNILVGTMSDLTGLVLKNTYNVVIKNFPKSTTITNKEFDVTIKNLPKDKEVQKVEVTNHQKLEFSTQVLEGKIDDLIKSGTLVPQELIALKKVLENAGKKNYDCVEELRQAVAKLKFDPVIKISTPEVKVPTPIVNIPATKFPEYPKEIKVSNIDFSEMVNQLEEIITELQYNAKQPVVVANIGDMPVATFNSKGIIDAIEAIPTTDTSTIESNQKDGSQVTKIVGEAGNQINPATDENLTRINQALTALRSAIGVAADIRVTVLSGTIGAVTTVTGLTNIGSNPANMVVPNLGNTVYLLSNGANVA